MKKKLKDICSKIHRGKTPKYVDESDVLVFAQKCNLQTGGIDLNKCLCLDTSNLKKWTEVDYLFNNDIVINSTGIGTLGRVGFFNIPSDKPIVPDTHVTVVRISDKETYPKWIYYFLKYSQDYLISKGHGSTKQQELATSEIEKIECPLPSYEFQRNGVLYLDSIQSAIDNKKQQLQQLDELVKSKFVEMFGDPIANEKNWDTVPLNDACDGIGDGLHGTPEYVDYSDFPFINGNNLETEIIVTPTTKFVSEETYKRHFIDITDNALLLSINGTLGKLAYYNSEKVMLGKSACYINLKKTINRYFVFGLMSSSYFLEFMEHASTKSTIKNVGLKAIRDFNLILPPIELQNDFATFVQKIDSAKSIIKTQLVDLQELLDSKMDEYFGE